MNTLRLATSLSSLALIASCAAEIAPTEPVSMSVEPLSPAARRNRAARIRDVAARAGLRQGWLLAGIADAETQMAHCHSELTWACRGPASADCGGGPVVAGAGDGPCSLRQGGLGMFQFDAGTFDDTLRREGSRILSLDGNIDAGLDFVVGMVIRSVYAPGVGNRAQAIDWMNGVRVDNARFDAWIQTVTRYYNGCQPGWSCWSGRLAHYRRNASGVYHEMGPDFWRPCTARCVDGRRIRGTDCGVGDCGAFGATCVDDSLGARCVSVFCEPRGVSKACAPDGDTLITCLNGAPRTGSCGAFGATCVDDALGARCVSVFCNPRGDHQTCLPGGEEILTCSDGAPTGVGDCAAYGATCVQDDLGARCVSVFCEPRGEHSACVPGTEVLLGCRDGGVASRGDCAAFGATCVDDELGARCVSVFCEPRGQAEVCAPGADVLLTCDDGAIAASLDCADDGARCVTDELGARCVRCDEGERSARCVDGRVERCDGGEVSVERCGADERCEQDAAGRAGCVGTGADIPEPPAPDAADPAPSRGSKMKSGCSAGGGPGTGGSMLALLLFALVTLRRRSRHAHWVRGAVTALVVAITPTSTAAAQTVSDIARRGACSTSGVTGLSRQLAETQRCMNPGQFVTFAPHAGVVLNSGHLHPYLQASARDALWAAARRGTVRVTSAFRTLADQYVLYHSGGCGLAASPGTSNHQSGRALDVSNWDSVRGALQSAGCTWLGSRDPVHFDCPGGDRRADTIRAFQRLWNINHPRDRIAEDGSYGPATSSRLARSPANGFPTGGCGCTPACRGRTGIRGADCGVGDCAAFGATCVDDSLGARCVSVFCEPRGASSACAPDGDTLITCRDGAPTSTGSCAAFGATCVDDSLGARCVSVFCEPRGTHRTCLPDGDRIMTCRNGAPEGVGSCGAFGATCVQDELGARCVSVFCEPRGEHTACVPDSEVLLTCSDGGIAATGDCAAFGATCEVDETHGARCVSVFCSPDGPSATCVPDTETLVRCSDGVLEETVDCAETGGRCVADDLGDRCVAPVCADRGSARVCDGERLVHCEDGEVVDSVACDADGGECVVDDLGGRCARCGADDRFEVCIDDTRVERCDGGDSETIACEPGTRCRFLEGGAACVPDAGPTDDETRGGGGGRGCAVAPGSTSSLPWVALLALVIVRRRLRAARRPRPRPRSR